METTWRDHLHPDHGDSAECHDETRPCGDIVQARLIAQAIDYSAAADQARHEPHLMEAHTAAHHATIKALAIVMGTSEADALEKFMETLNALEA